MKKTIIGQGAEATIIKKDNVLIKIRLGKSYRIPELDEKLRKQRTKKEAKLLQKSASIIPVPKLFKIFEKEREIHMQFIRGKKLADFLDELKNSSQICRQIGNNIAKLHDAGIIHGDLTTSNMIYNEKENKVYFIDFGLGYESSKIEDKAVDLHLIKQALGSKHYKNSSKFFRAILSGYKISKHYKQTFRRLEAVEKRGRYKQAY